MGTKKHSTIPLVMPFDERTTNNATKTSGMINVGIQESVAGQMEIVRRPGLALRAVRASVTRIAPGIIRSPVLATHLMVVYDGTWRLISYDGTSTPVLNGSMRTTAVESERIYWAQITTASTKGIIYGNRVLGVWASYGGPIVEMTDSDMPAGSLTGLAFIDGYTIASSDTQIHNSAIHDAYVWSALDVIKPSSSTSIYYTDLHSNHIVMFGNSSIEFFYNAGNPVGSILANRRDSRNEQVGLIYRPSALGTIKGSTPIIRMPTEDAYIFIGNTLENSRGIYILKDMVVNKISNSTIDNYLMKRITTVGNHNPFHLATTVSDGRTLVHLYIVYAGSPDTYSHHVLDIESGIWSQWSCNTGFDPTGIPIILAAGADGGRAAWEPGGVGGRSQQLFQNYDGTIGEVMDNSAQFTDTLINGNSYTINTTIISPKFAGDDGDKHKPKSLNRLQIRGAQTNNTTMSVSWSDNDYATYSTARDLLVTNDRSLKQCGRFFDRSFKLINTGNTEIRLSALELDYEVDE